MIWYDFKGCLLGVTINFVYYIVCFNYNIRIKPNNDASKG